MSRIPRIPRILWSASPVRAVAEALVVEAILLAVLLGSIPDRGVPETAYVGFIFGWMGTLCVLVCALRARLSEEKGLAFVAYEIGLTGLLVLAAQAVLLLAVGDAIIKYAAQIGTPPEQFLWLTVLFALTFFPLRLVMHLGRVWNRTRKRRLIWSMVHAQLLTVLAIVLFIILSQGITPPKMSLPGEIPWPLAGLIFATLGGIQIVLFYGMVAIPFLIGIMALGGVMSYFTSRPITRRIEALAKQTAALRGGDYAVRRPVDGEDEIAQLQADFNAMAADLEKTLSALKTERDTVSGLLQTRRELVAGVSHELRTPVATIRGYLDSALANWQDGAPSTLHHDLEIMTREAIRLQALIEDLFTLSRAEVGRLTLRCVPTDAAALIHRAVETSAPLAWARGKVQVMADLPESLPAALADSGRLEQILYNLIHNSLRHTPPGGIVAVAARLETEPTALRIEVRDTGQGILPEDLPHVWERFYRGGAEDARDGSAGLGLALVRELATAMGGSVAAESTPGQGSRFSIRLPVQPATA